MTGTNTTVRKLQQQTFSVTATAAAATKQQLVQPTHGALALLSLFGSCLLTQHAGTVVGTVATNGVIVFACLVGNAQARSCSVAQALVA